MSRFMRAINKFPALILRSPLHRLIGGSVLLLTFVGRKSAKKCTTPITYLREGDTVLLTIDSPWWKNLRGGALVALLIRGRRYAGVAEAITDETEIARVLEMMLDKPRGARKGRPRAGHGASPLDDREGRW